VKLHESHERALMSGLFVIECDLQRMKASLRDYGSAEQAITYRVRDNVDHESKSKILKVITAMLEEIRQMKETFELEADERSLKAEIGAALTEIWTILVDLEPERLRGYGYLSESEKALIETHVSILLSKLDELVKLLNP